MCLCVMMMDGENLLEDEEELLLLLLVLKKRQKQRKPRKRRFWVQNIFLERRDSRGTFHTLFQELLQDKELFFRYHG